MTMQPQQPERRRRRALGNQPRYYVHGVRRDPLDLKKFSRALLALVEADLETQALSEHQPSPEFPAESEASRRGGRHG
ncbi:hypothetical protein [Actinokineospora bangkokensis]|uniref:hypothetical protein n=1 Tax=Actinokineospora bangkokensis TaxID=1193682 RepID=UPI00117771B8|nr:hypothetical protein [Actinokineospora bangkokensis]